MELNDLLVKGGYDPAKTLVMRHKPKEPRLNRVLPWFAVDNPRLYNAYQQAQTAKGEVALSKASTLASFVAHGPGKALFVGLYLNAGSRPLSYDQYWAKRENVELEAHGMNGFDGERPTVLWFDLVKTGFHANWNGRLLVSWPGGERSWWRWADRNSFPVEAIFPSNVIEKGMPDWQELVLEWSELKSLPSTWRTILSQWRGIYFILDQSDARGYVGSAYGKDNILGRWMNYAASKHGGNAQLRKRDPKNFRFSILQRVSPDMLADDVVAIESAWKTRLSTRTHGLNDN